MKEQLAVMVLILVFRCYPKVILLTKMDDKIWNFYY